MKFHTGSEPWNHAAALYVRMSVFVIERTIAIEDEFDDNDESDRVYVVAYSDEGKPVATGRFQTIDDTTMRPGRIATLKEYRGQHLGAKIIEALEKYGREQGYTKSIIHSEMTAKGFYERQGYEVSSAPYEEDGVPAITLTKKLL
ncbi:GNAT family N-acetyltransferase [Lactobacillus sp. LC28-10]|uniref:GNAT family N-acetyltransferase n=1 Tax=Secundilactobacillus angelensis TaxID=2722706 RepID=A0ABX1KWK6_9LACO|nr:GNAT family N-acetyltransferase [Secundilactobacillus angelensis]MCH5461693.1 GNAT family N-acetyltransferase [Secundilactobacillus angelensis]NLR17989.1 GNAT family N-acetyltransferase [Secundilactobacillus angelensis]